MKKMFKFNKISIFIIGLGLGFSASIYLITVLFFNLFSKINIEFDLLSPISIVVTIFLAIYVAEKLNIHNEKLRVEKNIIIEDLRNFKVEFSSSIKEFFESKKIMYIDVTARLKYLRSKMNSISKLIEKYEFCNNKNINIDNQIRNIKDYLTDDFEVENGEIKIEIGQQNEINVCISEIDSDIFELIVEINRK